MLNNSNNNTIYLEFLLSTSVCVCVHGMQSTSPGKHQDTMDNPSLIKSSLSLFWAASSAPAQLVQATVQVRFKMTSCQQKQRAYGSFQKPPIETLWLQTGEAAPPQTPSALFFSPPRVCEKWGGGEQFSESQESELGNEGACSRYVMRGRVL